MLDTKLTFGGAFLMSKYSYEEKLDAVLRVVEDGMSYNASARITGTAKEHVRRWVMRYKQFGPEGLIVKHGSYDGAFKISVIEYMHANHLSAGETANYFRLAGSDRVLKWERIYYEEGPQALFEERRGRTKKMGSKKNKKNINENEDLLEEVQRLRMENEYLKKLNALVQERIKRENKKK